jgi:hypothetical protein
MLMSCDGKENEEIENDTMIGDKEEKEEKEVRFNIYEEVASSALGRLPSPHP